MSENPTVEIEPKPLSKAELKIVGGADRDKWNDRLLNLTVRALPLDQKNTNSVSQVGSAVMSGIVDMKPADPIEGMLISQLVVANEAALNLYRLAWLNNAEYFEASAKYLQLADKASRTVGMLAERLDQHRNRGHQQIVVKHVTVNADQALVTDSVVTGKNNEAASSAKLLAAATDKPMEIIEPMQQEIVPVGGGGAKEE